MSRQSIITHSLLSWPASSELLLVLICYTTAIYSALVWGYDSYYETSFFYPDSSTEIWTSSTAMMYISSVGTIILVTFLVAPCSKLGRALSFVARRTDPRFPNAPRYEPPMLEVD